MGHLSFILVFVAATKEILLSKHYSDMQACPKRPQRSVDVP